MKIETGMMIMKDGKAWGVAYEDGRSKEYGWVGPEEALIYDQRFCTWPSDVTYKGDHNLSEISSGKLVSVERITKVVVK